MRCCLSFAIVLALAMPALAEVSSRDRAGAASPKSVQRPQATVLAQLGDLGRMIQGGSGGRSGGGRSGGSHSGGSHSSGGLSGGGILGGLGEGGSSPGSGHRPPGGGDHHDGHGTIIPIPIPIPTRPPYNPGYYPPYYPTPIYPQPNVVTVPSNTVPTTPLEPIQPEANVVLVEPEANDFLQDLKFRPITVKELSAFKEQITKKNGQLGDELKKLLQGQGGTIDELVALANGGKLDAAALQKFVSAAGGGLSLQQQLQSTGLLKQLVFNNLALTVLLNVNINITSINITSINLVNVNLAGGGVFIGYWGFPWWPWNYPIWLGPGVWWGPCVYCPYPYYNPGLCGADALGVPYSITAPLPDAQGQAVTSGILLANAGTIAVNYTVDGQRFTMQPDYRQVIARRRVVVAFDRGGSFGQARYGIDEGWYKFTPTDRGWELYKQTARVTLDNAQNPFEFKYVLDNQRHSLAAGSQREHTGKYPLALRFDSGRGQSKQKILEKGVYKVAVGPDGGLDLFRPEDVTMPAPIAEMAKQFDAKTQNIFAKPEVIPSLFGETAQATAPPASPVPPGVPAPPTSSTPEVPDLFGTNPG